MIIIIVVSTRDEVAVAVLAVLAELVRVMLTVYAGTAPAVLRMLRVVRTVRMVIGLRVLVIGSKTRARIVRIFL